MGAKGREGSLGASLRVVQEVLLVDEQWRELSRDHDLSDWEVVALPLSLGELLQVV